MKNTVFTISLSLTMLTSVAQGQNPVTATGAEQKKKEAQSAIDKLTPEQRKMMEQMGIKIPGAAASASFGATDAQFATAAGVDGVPKKNDVLINAIPVIILTPATVAAYIKTLNDYVEKGIAADAKLFGQQVYALLKNNKYNAAAIGNSAIGIWASGNPDIAVYVMGRACSDNTSDEDLLSNFAAMLSMGGAPHKAIPLLQYLSKQYPDNTTVLNNLGQAWFYLGDIDKADANLEKVVRAFAYHPQANYTQCLIRESKGNITQAIEKLKNAISYSCSLNKLNKLRKLGYKIKGSEMRKPFRPEPDPLGLRNFVRPEAPATYDEELKLSADWDAFQQQVNDKSMLLAKQLVPYQQAGIEKAQQAYGQYKAGGVDAMATNTPQVENIYRKVAEKNLEEMNKDGGTAYRLKAARKQVDDLIKDYQAKDEIERKSLEKQYSVIASDETELAKKGENTGFDNCAVQQKYSEWVYTNYNKPLEVAYINYLHQLYLKITEELYWKQFTMDASAFEAQKIALKKEWLAAIGNTRYLTTSRYGKNCTPVQNNSSVYKLAEFDDMHCAFKSELDFIVYKQVCECGKSHVEFDAGRLNGQFNFKFDDKGNDRFVNGTLEVTAIDKSITAGKGPLQAGASIKAGMGMEFSSHGIEDVYVSGEAAVTAGTNIAAAQTINVTASGRMSLISGNMTGAISGFGK